MNWEHAIRRKKMYMINKLKGLKSKFQEIHLFIGFYNFKPSVYVCVICSLLNVNDVNNIH